MTEKISLSGEIKEMVTEINQIMRELENGYLQRASFKWLPYLGWWWRELDSDYDFGMSKPEGEVWWIDQPHKWDYNYYWFDPRKPEEMEKKRKVTEKILDLVRATRDYIVTTQEICGEGNKKDLEPGSELKVPLKDMTIEGMFDELTETIEGGRWIVTFEGPLPKEYTDRFICSIEIHHELGQVSYGGETMEVAMRRAVDEFKKRVANRRTKGE